MAETIVNCILKAMEIDLLWPVPSVIKKLNDSILELEKSIKDKIVVNKGNITFGELLNLLNEKVLNAFLIGLLNKVPDVDDVKERGKREKIVTSLTFIRSVEFNVKNLRKKWGEITETLDNSDKYEEACVHADGGKWLEAKVALTEADPTKMAKFEVKELLRWFEYSGEIIRTVELNVKHLQQEWANIKADLKKPRKYLKAIKHIDEEKWLEAKEALTAADSDKMTEFEATGLLDLYSGDKLKDKLKDKEEWDRAKQLKDEGDWLQAEVALKAALGVSDDILFFEYMKIGNPMLVFLEDMYMVKDYTTVNLRNYLIGCIEELLNSAEVIEAKTLYEEAVKKEAEKEDVVAGAVARAIAADTKVDGNKKKKKGVNLKDKQEAVDQKAAVQKAKQEAAVQKAKQGAAVQRAVQEAAGQRVLKNKYMMFLDNTIRKRDDIVPLGVIRIKVWNMDQSMWRYGRIVNFEKKRWGKNYYTIQFDDGIIESLQLNKYIWKIVDIVDIVDQGMKRGFTIPEGKIVRNPLPQMVRNPLTLSGSEGGGLIRKTRKAKRKTKRKAKRKTKRKTNKYSKTYKNNKYSKTYKKKRRHKTKRKNL